MHLEQKNSSVTAPASSSLTMLALQGNVFITQLSQMNTSGLEEYTRVSRSEEVY